MFRAIRNMINRLLGRPVTIDMDDISLKIPVMDIQGLLAGIQQPYQHDFNIQDGLINFDVVRLNRDDLLNPQPPAGGNDGFGFFRAQPAAPAQPQHGAPLRTMNPGVGG